MIEIQPNDIVYKLDKNVSNLTDIKIPQNATVFDASDCEKFHDIKSLNKYPALRVLLLSRTDIRSTDLQHLPTFIEAVDIRHCPNLSSYSHLPHREKKPLQVLISFGGERILNSIPDGVDIEIEGWINTICHKRKENILAIQNTRA